MREIRFIFALLTIVHGYPDPQLRRLVSRYNRYLGEPQSDFVYYNQRNTFQQPLDSYHENYNPYQSPIIFKPIESDLSQQSDTGHKSLNKIAEDLDTLISGKLADVGKLTEEISKVEDKIIEDANNLEDNLTDEVNKFQDELTDEVSNFDEEINGREVRNADTGENHGRSSIYFKDARNSNNNEEIPHKEYNNDPRIYFKDPVASGPDNSDSNIDTNVDDSPILFVEPKYNIDTSWPETTDSKYEIDATHIIPGIKFEKLINGAPVDEERKERTERAASYSTSGTRWNNYNGNYGQESVNYPRAHQQPNPFHSMGRDYGSSGYYVDSHEAQRETRGYMIGSYRPYSQPQITPPMSYNTGYDKHRGYGGNRQLSDVENGGQTQIDEEEFDDQKEYRGQQQTDRVEFGNQGKYVGQQQTDKFQFGGQREYGGQTQVEDEEFDSQQEYGGQKQTDDVEFGSQREHVAQEQTDYSNHGSQLQTDDVQFGSQKQTDDVQLGGQHQTDDVQFGGQREYGGQRQTHKEKFNGNMEYSGQQQTDNVEFGNQREHVGQKQTDNVEFGGQRVYGSQKQTQKIKFNGNMEHRGQQQTDNVEFGNQREYVGQKQTDYSNHGSQQQTDDVEFGNQREHISQKQTDYGNHGSQQQTDDVEFGSQVHDGQQQTDDVEFGGQREYGIQKQNKAQFGGNMEYSGQQQTDNVEFGNQREHVGQKQTDYSTHGSQQQTDDVEFGSQGHDGQQQTDDVEFGGQREYGSQKQTQFGGNMEYSGQEQTDNVEFGNQREHVGQQQTDDVEFGGQRVYGSQKQTHKVKFNGNMEHSGQQQTDNVEFGNQREYVGQKQTDYSNHGSQQQTDDVEFGNQGEHDGQQQTDDVQFGGQHQTDDVQFGGQQQTDDVQFGGQHQTDDVQFGGQQQTDDVQFGGQHQTDDVQFGGQHQTDDVQFGGQHQTDDVQFGGQHQTDDVQFGGQQQVDDIQFEGQKQTDQVQFGGQTVSGSLPDKGFDGQQKSVSRYASRNVFDLEREYSGHVRPDIGTFNKGNPQSASFIPGAMNQNPYRTYIGHSQVKTETQMHGGYSGSRQTDISTNDNARKYDNPHKTMDTHSAQGGNQQPGYSLFNNQRSGYQNNRRGYEHNGNKYLSSHGHYEELDEQSRTKTESKNIIFNKSSIPSPTTSPSYQNSGYSESRQQSFSSSGYGSYSHGYSRQPQHSNGYGSHSYPGIPTQRNNYATPTLILPADNQRFSEQESVLPPERVVTVSTPVGINRYKKVESLLDELEKDLIEQQTDKIIEVFIPTVKASSSAAYTSSNGYMEYPTASDISYTPYLTPSAPQFEYNSDEEEEEKPSFWSNLGNKMKNTYNQAKDKTKQVITDIKEKIA